MKKFFYLSLVFICVTNLPLLAQDWWNLPTATQFDKFINNSDIEWAVYAYDSFRLNDGKFLNLLCSRLERKEIKASYPIGSGTYQANKINYTSKENIDGSMLYPSCRLPIYDSLGNALGEQRDPIPFIIDSARINFIEILYVKDGILKSYIPWIAPTTLINTSSGFILGVGEYFNTCFNFKYDNIQNKQDKIQFLTKTITIFNPDSIKFYNELKELYGRNVVETMWSNITSNKTKIFSLKTNKRLNANALTTELIENFTQPTTVYDSIGKAVEEKFFYEKLNPNIFTGIELYQEWYYNYTKNIVFNKIKEIHLYTNKYLYPETKSNELSPILKLVY